MLLFTITPWSRKEVDGSKYADVSIRPLQGSKAATPVDIRDLSSRAVKLYRETFRFRSVGVTDLGFNGIFAGLINLHFSPLQTLNFHIERTTLDEIRPIPKSSLFDLKILTACGPYNKSCGLSRSGFSP
jgi:hypothetical protein